MISRRFDFLGYRFAPSGLGVAQVTVKRFLTKVSRLYEQGATDSRIGETAIGGGSFGSINFGCKDFRLESKQGTREIIDLFSSQSKI